MESAGDFLVYFNIIRKRLWLTILLFIVVATRRRISRLEGAVYVLFYVSYITLVYLYPEGIRLLKLP